MFDSISVVPFQIFGMHALDSTLEEVIEFMES